MSESLMKPYKQNVEKSQLRSTVKPVKLITSSCTCHDHVVLGTYSFGVLEHSESQPHAVY